MKLSVDKNLITNLVQRLDSKLITNENLRKFHLVWVKGDSIPYLGQLCMQSIRNHNPEIDVILHYTNPELINNEDIKRLVKEYNIICNKVNVIDSIENVDITRVTAQSDIIRLLVVYLYGGIYVDTDMIILKNFESLFEKFELCSQNILLGREVHRSHKLVINNGMIMGKKSSDIIGVWLNNISLTYKEKNGWSEHGVELITKLYPIFSKEIILFDSKFFHPFPFWKIEKMLQSNKNYKYLCDCFLIHLFNNSCKSLFEKLEISKKDYIKDNSNLFTKIINYGINYQSLETKLSNTNIDKNLKYDPYNTVHFVNFNNVSEFGNINTNCIRSLRYHNPDIDIVFHTNNANLIPLNIIQELSININLITFENIEISKDDIRFYILYLYGGMIYDNDIITLQSLKPIFDTLKDYPEKIICCKEKHIKDFYINDGMLVSVPKNKIVRELIFIKNSNNYCKKLKFFTTKFPDSFIILSELNFNPINFYQAKELLNSNLSEKEIFELLRSSYGVNLFAKSTKEIFDTLDLNSNTLLAKLVKFGIGNDNLYKSSPLNQEIHYINLKKRPERNLFFIATWNRIFDRITRFDAVLTQGKINGCGKSHHTIVQNSIEHGSVYTIVLEDDAIPVYNFIEKFEPILDYAKTNYTDFDLITLASPTLVNLKNKTCYAKTINENLISIDNCSSSHFIIYSKTILPFFDRFYNLLFHNKTKETNQDWFFNLQSDLRKMITVEFLSFQYFGFFSDVVAANRESDFFSNGEKQLEVIKEKLYNKEDGNLFNFIDKKIISF